MQFARNVSSLFLLRGDQPSGKIFYPGIASAQSFLALAQRLLDLLALGNINDQAIHFQALTAFVVNGLAAPFYPAQASVRPDDAVFGSVLSLLLDRSSHRLLRHRQVIRVHPVSPGVIIRLVAEWHEAHDCVMLLGPLDGVGSRVPFPDPHAPRFEREPQTFFALAPLLLGLFAFGDITSDRLKFDDLSVRVEDRMVNPLLPADSAVGQQHLVLVYLNARVFD